MSDIIGFEACSQELKRLLAEIEAAIKSAKESGPEALHAAVMNETRKLVGFTNRTEPANILDPHEVENIRKIDQIADEARREIFADSSNAIISRMQDRISQLNQLEKTVRQQAAQNEQDADKIRLIPVKNAIATTTEAIDAIKEAKLALSGEKPEEAVVKSKIESVLRAITALEKAGRELLG
jgi:hypothetical protein